MHRLHAALLASVLSILPISAAAAQFSGASGSGRAVEMGVRGTIQGNALSSTNTGLPDMVVRLRDARAGRIVQTGITDRTGLFVFRGVEPGSYIVELVGKDQSVLAASVLLDVNAGDTVSAIVRLPFRIQPFAGVLGHTTMSALLVTATAAATGVLAAQVAGEPVSPRR
jgi:hypothetical protein